MKSIKRGGRRKRVRHHEIYNFISKSLDLDGRLPKTSLPILKDMGWFKFNYTQSHGKRRRRLNNKRIY